MKHSVILFFFLINIIVPNAVLAELSPSAYLRMAKKAPEHLIITVVQVDKWFSRIAVEATISKVDMTETGLQVGQNIKIKYSHRPHENGMVGPAPIPILKEKHVYSAYLEKSLSGNYYVPAARGKSFSEDPLLVDTRVEECFQTIYFDYDQLAVKESERSKVDKMAACLKRNPSIKLRLDGHTDERGTEDYNFLLGERQALTVKALLVESGIDEKRLDVLSFSELAPVDNGHTEKAWARNRRVETTHTFP